MNQLLPVSGLRFLGFINANDQFETGKLNRFTCAIGKTDTFLTLVKCEVMFAVNKLL